MGNLFAQSESPHACLNVWKWVWISNMAVVWIRRGHCPSYRQGMSVGPYADYGCSTGLAGCLYKVIHNHHKISLLNCDGTHITDGAHQAYLHHKLY